VNIPGAGEMKTMVRLTSSAICVLCFGLLCIPLFFLFVLPSLSFSFSFFSRLLSSILLSLLYSLAALLVSYALPPFVFSSKRSLIPLFFFLSSLVLLFLSLLSRSFFSLGCSTSSGFYSHRMHAFSFIVAGME